MINYLKNRLLKLGLTAGLTLSAACSGREAKIELSDMLQEDAIVTETIYSPSRHGSGSGIGPTVNFDGNI